MNTQLKISTVISIAALAAGPLAFAENTAPTTPEIAICEAAPEIAVCPEPYIFPEAPEVCVIPPPTEAEDPTGRIHIDPMVEELVEPIAGPEIDSPTEIDSSEGGDGEVSENEVVDSSDPSTETEASVSVEGDTVVTCGEHEVPIEWLKRDAGDGDPSVMYYSMADGSAPVPVNKEVPGALARELGQDDKAAAIQTKATTTTTAPKILSDKKEPVALIKKGRVFLR